MACLQECGKENSQSGFRKPDIEDKMVTNTADIVFLHETDFFVERNRQNLLAGMSKAEMKNNPDTQIPM